MARLRPLLLFLASAAVVLAGLVFVSSSRADVVIGELRGSGATADDDFVELLNRGSAAVNLAGWRLDARAADDSAAGSVTLPAQTIAPRGKLLVTAPGYSLAALAGSNDALAGELPSGGSIALIDPVNATQDAVRFAAGTVFGEGGPLGSFAAGGQYAFVRKANRTGTGDGYGLPTDTNDNAADFALVVPQGQTDSAGSALPSIEGVPGPENLSSAPIANAALQVARLDTSVGANVAPNRQIADPDGGGPLPQTLYLRRTVTNISGLELAELQFRVTAITTARSDPQAGQSIIRLDSSDNSTVAGKPITPVALQRSMQTPLPDGGGLNALVRVPSISPIAPLAPGASINVEFALRIAQSGAFQVILNTEAKRVNDAPTDITLSPTSVAENQPPGTTVGSFSTTDPDPNDTHSYSLVTGTGDSDNAAFQIVGDTLQTNQSFDFETKSSYSIRVRSSDDGAPAKFVEKVFTISVTDANDPPSDISLSNASVDENQPAGTAVGTLSAADQESGQTHTFALVSGSGSTDNGAFQIVGGTLQTAQSFDFETKNSYSIRVRATDNGSPAESVEKVFTIAINDINDAPVADDETFNGNDSAHGNTAMVVNDPDDGAPNPTHPKTTVSGDILAGDTDVDGPGPLTVTPGTFATNDGGSVTIEADGDFTFHPAASTSCTDTSDFFDYTVEDSGSPELTDTGRVTIAIAGCVWYVSNNAAGNSGTSAAPFDTLAQAETASGANHTVFVFDGDNTSTGLDAAGYAMNAGERLIGEHEGLVVDPDGGGALTADTLHPANPGFHPTLTATNADVIDLDDGNEVRGFNVDPQGTGGGIAGGAGDTGGGTIDDVNVVDTLGANGTQAGLELNGTTGTFNISNFTVTNNATGVLLNNAGTVNFTPAGTITITSAGARGLDATGTNMGTSVFDGITVTGSGNGGVSMTNTTNPAGGSTTFDGLSLTTTGGTGFLLNNAGTVSVPAAGTANVNATGGPAVDVTGTAGAALAFDNVSSTNSPNDGINLAGLGTGTFSATGGTIAGAAGIAFDLDGGSGAISYAGALNNGAGATAEITGRGGGAVTLSGAIADTNDAGGGITVTGNTGGSTTFSNASKVINTGAANAVAFTASDGHTLTLSGGGLNIVTTTGQGVVATGSGTINVAGAGNAVTSTSGRAVNVQTTDFGGSGFTFQSVSSNGAPNGILLNNTGTTAGMTITGTGANNSGGTIQNATEHGVSLTTTNNFNADELSITGANFAGVDGTDVTNFTFTDGEILNAGDSQTNNLHGAIAFNDQAANENNVDGTVVITGNLLKDHYGGGVDVFNRNGTISDATVSNNTIDSTANEATSREDAISFNLFGSASTVASMTKAQIEDNVITDHPSGNGIVLLGAQTNIAPAPPGSIGVPGSATNRVLIDGNLLTGDPVNRFGGAAILAGVEGRGAANFDITNNGSVASPITNAGTHAIATGNSGSSEVEYLIENNRINANNFEAGGLGIRSASDRHIMVGGSTLATPILKTIINNNVVRNTTGGGIRVLAANSNGTSEVKVTNNDVANGAAGAFPIRVENGSSVDATFDPTMCATISGNTTAANAPTPGGNTAPGIGLFKRATVAADYQFGIVGLSPSPSTNANTEAFVTGQNPASSLGGGFWAGKRVTVDAGNNFVSCTHPPGF